MRWRWIAAALAVCWTAVPTAESAAAAEARTGATFRSPAHLSAPEKRELETARDRINAGIVGIVTGGIDGTYLRIATDLSAALDDPDGKLRVLPIAGKGSVQNIWDIVFARGVDLGIVQSDVLAYAKAENIFPAVDEFVQLVAHLYDEEVHVLASTKIKSIEDLAFKRVNFDGPGSGTYMTANLLFRTLGFPVAATTFDQPLALEKLKRGEIDALVYVAGKPVRLFQDLRPEDNLHFLAIPPTPDLLQIYSAARLTGQDYPLLFRPGIEIETISVGAVLASYAWERSHARYSKVARFVDAFFAHAGDFQIPPRHPKWRDLSLATVVPGWKRFPAAERWLRSAALRHPDFAAFAAEVKPGGISSPDRQEALMAEYLRLRGTSVAEAPSDKSAQEGSGSSTPPSN